MSRSDSAFLTALSCESNCLTLTLSSSDRLNDTLPLSRLESAPCCDDRNLTVLGSKFPNKETPPTGGFLFGSCSSSTGSSAVVFSSVLDCDYDIAIISSCCTAGIVNNVFKDLHLKCPTMPVLPREAKILTLEHIPMRFIRSYSFARSACWFGTRSGGLTLYLINCEYL